MEKKYLKIELGSNGKWCLLESNNKKDWNLRSEMDSFVEVMKIKEQVVLNNYKSLFDLITNK